MNVLSQIGLGYLFVYALLGRRFWIQLLAFVVILAGYWGFFYSYTPLELITTMRAVGAPRSAMLHPGQMAHLVQERQRGSRMSTSGC